MSANPVKVFISYAHEDESFKDELTNHLKPLEREGLIDSWNDRELLPGQEWDAEIKTAMEESEMILLLVSIDFITSDYIHDVEIAKALQRYERNEVVIVPIIVRPIDWASFRLGKFQALPEGAKPIRQWEDRDEAWISVTQGLRGLIRRLRGEGEEKERDDIPPAPPTPPTEDPLEEATDLIAEARLGDALTLVRRVAKSKAPYLENDLINLSGQFSRLKRDEGMGVVSAQQANVQRAKITQGLLGLIEDLRRR